MAEMSNWIGCPTAKDDVPFAAMHCVRSAVKLIVLVGLAGWSLAESSQPSPAGGPNPPGVPDPMLS